VGKTTIRGYHLIANGEGVTCQQGDIARFLLRARLLTGLTKIAPACISEEYGQGFVLIAESHIAIAIHDSQGYADVFSCRPFKARAVVVLLRTIFGGRWVWGLFRRSVPPASPSAGGFCETKKAGAG
jgi:hypothetical protein